MFFAFTSLSSRLLVRLLINNVLIDLMAELFTSTTLTTMAVLEKEGGSEVVVEEEDPVSLLATYLGL